MRKHYGECGRQLRGGRRCKRLRHVEANEYCAACQRENNRRNKRAAAKVYPPEVKGPRRHISFDLSTTRESDLPVPQFRWGTVQFWRDWYYNQHDEESMVRWEERIGLGHDAWNGWDSRYGVGGRPAYVKHNTVK